MTIHEINEAIDLVMRNTAELEEAYIENGGEVTESTEAQEAEISAIKALLTDANAIDTLGRWLKSKEDEKTARKAEKAKLDQMMKSTENTISYIKERINVACRALGIEKAKGMCYAFTPYLSTKTEVDKETLMGRYGEIAEKALREAGIPEYVTFSLGASVSAVPEGEDLPDFFISKTEETCKFNKPRAIKG